MFYISSWDYTKNTTPKNITVAILQYEPEINDKEANIIKIKKLIKDAILKAKNEDKKLNLIVLPELATTGPVKGLEEAGKLTETLNGTTVRTFKEIAKDYSLYIVFGMVEKDKDKLYNTAVLVSPKGDVIGKYRKTHLNELDKQWAQPGDEIKVFSTELGKIGVMIGYDAAFPEVAGVMAVKRADIIVIPSAWNGDFGKEIKIDKNISTNRYPEGAMCLWDSITMSSQAYTIVSNFIGSSNNYLGRSALYTLDPLYGLDQPVIASKDREEALIVSFKTIQPDWWFNQEKLISSRRTFFYKPLVH
ncbi:MAG: hypothetical protein PWQ82_416 [Thermosediminibacterales bacterium]|nr:hypothetical protein [Thermosediminibacterales bacterium]